jgi:hypothetical protein
MAQVSFPIVDLPTRDSSLQIFSYPKQEDLAVQGLLSDREKVVDVIYRPRTCKSAPDRYRLSECESAP